MQYRMKRVPGVDPITAHQWHRNGDHPGDGSVTYTDLNGKPFRGEGRVVRDFRRPQILGASLCTDCGVQMHDHGFIDQRAPEPEEGVLQTKVCPGAYVIDLPNGRRYALPQDIFQREYEPIR